MAPSTKDSRRSGSQAQMVPAGRLRRCVLRWRGLVGGVLLRRALLPVLVVVVVIVGRHGRGEKAASRLSRSCRPARGVQ